MSKDVNVKLSIDGIGPHSGSNKIDDLRNCSTLKTAIYAENGAGKTFISRMFSLATHVDEQKDYSKLISLGKAVGNFSYTLKSDDKTSSFSVRLQNHQKPQISISGINYTYHVFNSDFVKSNVETRNFTIDGENITGYVIGKDNIDVSKEESELSNLEKRRESIEVSIKTEVERQKKELVRKGVNRNTNEYKRLTVDCIIEQRYTEEKESFEAISSLLDNIKNIPNEIPQLIKSSVSIDITPLSIIDGLLKTSYSRIDIDKKVITRLRKNHTFYHSGLMIYEDSDSNTCPFCNHELDEDGMFYINLYKQYFDDEEAQIIGEIEKNINQLEFLKQQLQTYINNFQVTRANFYQYRGYLPNFKDKDLAAFPDSKDAITAIDSIIAVLNQKKQNIAAVDFNIDDSIKRVVGYISLISKVFSDAASTCESLENNLKDSAKVKLDTNRRLCKAAINHTINALSPLLTELQHIKDEIQNIKETISAKQMNQKTSKKELVTNSMCSFLKYFFNDKYTFDSEKYVLMYKDHSLESDASDFLSDGEKSIIAFCYYLATTHLLVDNEEDYNLLYFIIDDPISSMDFSYVFAVTGIIRELNSVHFPKIKRLRFLILTHNAEFMAMLIRNNISSNNYALKNGKISKISDELLMPYNYHIKDLKRIVDGVDKPNHTTGNMIRHILETIMRFEDPTEHSLSNYILKSDFLKDNHYLYTYINDYSHGVVRNQTSITEEEIIKICSDVFEFIKSRFPNQFLICSQ